MKNLTIKETHPKALIVLFFTEMWERFSYYGMRALLTLYLIEEVSKGGLGWSSKEAGQLYGIYTGLVYLTPLIGGILATDMQYLLADLLWLWDMLLWLLIH
jgi:proton-dependent oligopeptide transporter, POT family